LRERKRLRETEIERDARLNRTEIGRERERF